VRLQKIVETKKIRSKFTQMGT